MDGAQEVGETLVTKVTTATVLAGNGGVVLVGDTVLTADGFMSIVFMNVTVGAWMEIGLGLSLLFILMSKAKGLYIDVLKPLAKLFRGLFK